MNKFDIKINSISYGKVNNIVKFSDPMSEMAALFKQVYMDSIVSGGLVYHPLDLSGLDGKKKKTK